jgi:hypothetical protein
MLSQSFRSHAAHRVSLTIGLLGIVVTAAMMLWVSGFSGQGNFSMAWPALHVLVTSAPWPVLWLAAAVGFGWPLRIVLLGDKARWQSDQRPSNRAGGWTNELRAPAMPIQAGLGIAFMLLIDSALGAAGLLQVGSGTTPVGAWLVIAFGLVLLVAQLTMQLLFRQHTIDAASRSGHMVCHGLLFAAPAIAVLLIASCSAPGWLWSSEFGGYDALSYHLQLPKEWMLIRGRIVPLEHNVYSFLPGYVEAGYYHIALLAGDAHGFHFVYACQLLHAFMAMISAWILGCATASMFAGQSWTGLLAFVLLLGTPWIIVVGSLAYNEIVVVAMLALGLTILYSRGISLLRRAAALGFVAGIACGAKLTSVGFVAAPLFVLFLISMRNNRTRIAHSPAVQPMSLYSLFLGIAFFLLCVILALAPYFFRNWMACGNPIFPFGSSVFGLAHWIAEQHTTFTRGHQSQAGLSQRLYDLWNQVFRLGIGPNPSANSEPWKAQWSILPWLAGGGIVIGLIFAQLRRQALQILIILTLQTLFFIFFTHVKSRFMVPASVPMSLAAILGAFGLAHAAQTLLRRHQLLAVVIGGAACLMWTAQPVLIFASERNGSPAAMIGHAGALSGDELDEATRRDLGQSTFSALAVNHLLPPNSRVLLVGEAAPLYYDLHRINYCTTWDRGPLSAAMRTHPDSPQRWHQALRDQGYTHLLVNEEMLQRWEDAGWNDPLITRGRVVGFAKRVGVVEFRYPAITIFRLRE